MVKPVSSRRATVLVSRQGRHLSKGTGLYAERGGQAGGRGERLVHKTRGTGWRTWTRLWPRFGARRAECRQELGVGSRNWTDGHLGKLGTAFSCRPAGWQFITVEGPRSSAPRILLLVGAAQGAQQVASIFRCRGGREAVSAVRARSWRWHGPSGRTWGRALSRGAVTIASMRSVFVLHPHPVRYWPLTWLSGERPRNPKGQSGHRKTLRGEKDKTFRGLLQGKENPGVLQHRVTTHPNLPKGVLGVPLVSVSCEV